MTDPGGDGGGAVVDSQALATIITLIAFCFFCFNGYCFRNTTPADDPADDPIAGWIPNPSNPTASLKERRADIESKLIIRHVVESEDTSVRSTNSTTSAKTGGWLSSRSVGAYVGAFSTRRSSSQRTVRFSEPKRRLNRSQSAPHPPSVDSAAPRRSSSSPQVVGGDLENPTREEQKIEEEVEEEAPEIHQDEPESACIRVHRRKTDILARGLATTLRSKPMDYEQPTTCDICLMDYEVGEEVAWSPYDACVHAFHKDCIVDWLLRNPKCPLCRNDYVHDSNE